MNARHVVESFLEDVLNGTGDAARAVDDPRLAHRVEFFRSAFPDLWVETNVLFEAGDLVGGHFTGRATHAGLFQGVPATGVHWTAGCTAIYRVRDERIAESWLTWDLLGLLEQLGALERAQTVSA